MFSIQISKKVCNSEMFREKFIVKKQKNKIKTNNGNFFFMLKYVVCLIPQAKPEHVVSIISKTSISTTVVCKRLTTTNHLSYKTFNQKTILCQQTQRQILKFKQQTQFVLQK